VLAARDAAARELDLLETADLDLRDLAAQRGGGRRSSPLPVRRSPPSARLAPPGSPPRWTACSRRSECRGTLRGGAGTTGHGAPTERRSCRSGAAERRHGGTPTRSCGVGRRAVSRDAGAESRIGAS
jgi:hypothetical protein